MCVGVTSSGVFDTIASLEEQCAEPTILALIVLDVVTGLVGAGRVLAHYVVVHESLATEERKAPGTTQNAADHVFGGLLQPVTNCVFEELVPHHRPGSHWVNAAASGSQVAILLH